VLQEGKASVSYIQRRLKIGFNGSPCLVEMMEEKGIADPAKGSKPRDVLDNVASLRAIYPGKQRSKPSKGFKKYPYLLRGKTIWLPNQVWASDITYLGLP